MSNWFVVHTKPSQEQTAADNLRRQGFEVFCPKASQSLRRRGRWSTVVSALFPRYIFVFVEQSQQSVAPIRSTTGVTDLVRFGDQLVPIPTSVIEVLKGREDAESGLIELDCRPFDAGDRVSIAEGPMAGIEGVFQAERGRDRVMILLNILGREQSVVIAPNNLVKVTPAGRTKRDQSLAGRQDGRMEVS